MQGRAADVRDVSERLLQALSSQNENVMMMDEPVIIEADDLVPSETVQLDKEKVLSFRPCMDLPILIRRSLQEL